MLDRVPTPSLVVKTQKPDRGGLVQHVHSTEIQSNPSETRNSLHPLVVPAARRTARADLRKRSCSDAHPAIGMLFS